MRRTRSENWENMEGEVEPLECPIDESEFVILALRFNIPGKAQESRAVEEESPDLEPPTEPAPQKEEEEQLYTQRW
ncbi:hypothetical protein NDU88_002371 [Pleurodeles waltl]|uniref:Uncharacterized protein n=1 Tax=Pleurodeles waltl TaxID=8319 RepID=A0AAV7PAN2_PLEWA|nr:hypothetical protein NDU88_002371 [Pleurodeles waltl]